VLQEDVRQCSENNSRTDEINNSSFSGGNLKERSDEHG
jgi:hypothetical protein